MKLKDIVSEGKFRDIISYPRVVFMIRIGLAWPSVSLHENGRDAGNLVPRAFSRHAPKPGKRPWERGWDAGFKLTGRKIVYLEILRFYSSRLIKQEGLKEMRVV